MNQVDVETFLMLVKTENITKTAQNLFVSQPTVSHRLKLLEDELGVPLLIRKKGHKRLELTPKGEEFVPIAERWLALMDETRMLKSKSDLLYLSVGCTDTLNATIFKGLYRKILQDESIPLHLNISTHYSYVLYENVQNYLVDAGFVYHYLHFKNIVAEPVLHEKMYLVQEAGGAIRKEKLYLREMNPDSEVYFTWETNFQAWHEQMISGGNRASLEVDTFSLLSEFLKDRGKWTIAPRSVVDELSKIQNIYVSQIADRRQPPERVTYMIMRSDVSESRKKAIALFRAQMRNYFRELGYEE